MHEDKGGFAVAARQWRASPARTRRRIGSLANARSWFSREEIPPGPMPTHETPAKSTPAPGLMRELEPDPEFDADEDIDCAGW